ncbi:MAG: ArgE/DapE family deacylase [Thermomicrobiales bacterium]
MSRDSAREQLFAAIDARQDELITIVEDLIRFPSTLGNERPAQEYVARHLAASGFATELWELDDAIKQLPNAGESGVPFAGRPNVSAHRAGTGGGKSLILNGHIDVVSAEPVELWDTDPYQPTRVGDRLFGRGAWDMKSGVAMNLFLARLISDLSIPLQGALTIQSVIEEECTGNGSLAASRHDRADGALISESTNQNFLFGHVGVMWFKIAITGKTWHAMQAWAGVNAIEKAVPIILALKQLDTELNVDVHPLFTQFEHPINLNIGVITGGDWPSTVPGSCELGCRVSFYPGVTVAEMRAKIEATIATVTASDPWLTEHPPVVTYYGFGSEGAVVALDHPLVQTTGDWHERVTGSPIVNTTSTAINDSRYFNLSGIPCGCYGARGANAHGANEWLDVSSLAPTMKVLAASVLDWCGVG